jgi:hypothetical protein
VGQKAVGAVEEKPCCCAEGRSRHPRGKRSTVGRERRGVTVDPLKEREIAERGRGSEPGKCDAGTGLQPDQRHDSERGRRRDQLHVQPGQRRRESGRGHCGGDTRWERENQTERAPDGEAGGHLGVDVEGVVRRGWSQGEQPRELRRAMVSAEPQGEGSGHEREGGRHRREEEHAGPPAAERVDGREEHGQPHRVSGERTSIGPRRAPVWLDVGRRVLLHLTTRLVVAQVQIAVAPEALGHEQIVGLVAGDLQVRGVVHSDTSEEDEARREESEGGSPEAGEGPKKVPAASHCRHRAGEKGKYGAEGATKETEGGQGLHRQRHVGEYETGSRCEEEASSSHYCGLSSK